MQLQDDGRNIQVLGFDASYIICFMEYHRHISLLVHVSAVGLQALTYTVDNLQKKG